MYLNSNKDWYNHLHKSKLTPPPIVFSIVWPVLYTLMAISLFYLIRNRKNKVFKPAIICFGLQLVFNLLWPFIFFKKHKLDLALTDLLITVIFTGFTIYYFYLNYKPSSYLLITYFLWICFASYLNSYIVVHN